MNEVAASGWNSVRVVTFNLMITKHSDYSNLMRLIIILVLVLVFKLK